MDFTFPSEELQTEDFAPVQVMALCDYYKNCLGQMLDKMGKEKTKRLFIDRYCYNLIRTFIDDEFVSKNFKGSIIEIGKNNKGAENMSEIKEDVALFITHPDKEIFETVTTISVYLESTRPNTSSNIIFIPGESYDLIEFMTLMDLTKKFNIYSFNIDLLPIDNDLLSLEDEDAFREIYIDKNLSSISSLADAILKLQTCFGKIKYKYLKGDYAKLLDDLLIEKEKENNLKTTDEILGMVVLDRSVDLITPVLSNYTYEGLIDEYFEINGGITYVKENIILEGLTKVTSANNKFKYKLTSNNDPFYASIRCMHYMEAIRYMQIKYENFKNLVKQDKESKATVKELEKETNELKNFMKIKNSLVMNKNLIDHISGIMKDDKYTKNEQLLVSGDLPDELYRFYEEYLGEKKDLHKILRLMAIQSLTQEGVKDYNELKREILNIYGYQKIFLFRELERLGFLGEKKVLKKLKLIEWTYEDIFQKLGLLNYEYDSKKITDCSYITGGYCPLSLRLIEKAVEGKWAEIADTVKRMKGPTAFPNNESEISKPKNDLNTIFVVFVGGVTYAEIEGIRFLNRKFKEDYDKNREKCPTRKQIIIITTGILNHKKIFGGMDKQVKCDFTMKDFYNQGFGKK